MVHSYLAMLEKRSEFKDKKIIMLSKKENERRKEREKENADREGAKDSGFWSNGDRVVTQLELLYSFEVVDK